MFVCLYIHVRMNNGWILFICLKKDISVWDSIDESGVYCAKWSKHSSEEKYCLVTFIEVSGFCFPGTTHRTLYLDLSGVFEVWSFVVRNSHLTFVNLIIYYSNALQTLCLLSLLMASGILCGPIFGSLILCLLAAGNLRLVMWTPS